MKRFKIWSMMMLVVMTLPMIVACGGDDSSDELPEPPQTNIILSKTSLMLTFGESESVTVSGANATECNVIIDDDYVAYVSTNKNTVNIVSRHVGKTKVTISYKGSSASIDVQVKPTLNIIGTHYFEIGDGKNTVCEALRSFDIENTEDGFYIFEDNAPVRIMHHYYFSSDKLDYITTRSYQSQQTNKYQSQYRSVMNEYAQFQEEYYSKYHRATIYIYNRNNKYLIGMRPFENNDKGWYICYAKTKDDVINNIE